MDKSESTCPYYEQFNTEVRCETQKIQTLNMNVLTMPILDHLPGSLRIGDRLGSGGLLLSLGGEERTEPTAAPAAAVAGPARVKRRLRSQI